MDETWDNRKAMLQRQAKAAMAAGRSGLQHSVFGRTFIILLLTLAQALVIVTLISFLHDYSVIGFVVVMVINMIVVVYILNRDTNPSFKIAWLVPVLALPVLGTPAYLIFQSNLGSRRLYRRLVKAQEDMAPQLRTDQAFMDSLTEQSPKLGLLATYISQIGGFPPYTNAKVQYFPSGEAFFDELLARLEDAREHIYMEFFIVAQGHMWEQVLSILRRKAEAGIDVRVLYDGTNSLVNLPYNYDEFLSAAGVPTRQFSSLKPLLSSVQNNRDHRKVVVIDNEVAFTGGVNLADEYINLKERFGHWKDNAVMVTGEAVRNFSAMFLQMWHAVPEDGTPAEALPEVPGHAEADARNLVIPYADSPLDYENIGKSVYLDLINHAKRYVHIFTPYLVLDSETDTALRFAAKKGVEVHFILPHIPDKKYVYLIAHNQYPRLIASGVHISEYTPGFVHAKTMVADDEVAVVGTINMDFRSYYLHFENAVLFTQEDAVADVEADFQKTLKDCHEVTLKECENYPLYQRVLGWIFQMFAPLM